VVIDEQHRFGTAQRRKLVRKGRPGPAFAFHDCDSYSRTLALTIYGDLDLSLLDDAGWPKTNHYRNNYSEQKRGTYEKVREELKKGRQLYVICPRIEEPDSAKEMAVQAKIGGWPKRND